MASDFVRVRMRVPYLFSNLIGLVRIPGEPCLCLPQPRYPTPNLNWGEVRLRETPGKCDPADTLCSYAGTYIVRMIHPSHEPNLSKNVTALHYQTLLPTPEPTRQAGHARNGEPFSRKFHRLLDFANCRCSPAFPPEDSTYPCPDLAFRARNIPLYNRVRHRGVRIFQRTVRTFDGSLSFSIYI